MRHAAGMLLWVGLLVVSYRWAGGGGITDLGGWASGLTSLGRLTGLLASVLLLVQVLLMARVLQSCRVGVLAAELATQDHLSGGRLNVGVGAGWMPEEFAAASVPHLFPRRHAHVRETLEIMQGTWSNELFEYHGEFADFPLSGFGHKPIQQPRLRSTGPRFIGESATRT